MHDPDIDGWIHNAAAAPGLERIEAYFGSHGYGLHRHDTYAIGLTLAGVQRFHYRRSLRASLAGTAMVLHPDELHDGHAGTADGFRYRMLYLAPGLLQQVLGGRALPFVEGGLSGDAGLRAAVAPLLADLSRSLEPLEQSDALIDLATQLCRAAGASPRRSTPDAVAARRARDYLDALGAEACTLQALERISGRDRYRLSRDFRVLYGTSPYRYLSLRRLERARRAIASGVALPIAALDAGFADQSHLTRQFARAYGLPPARWRRLLR